MALSFQDSVNKQKLLKNVENEVSTVSLDSDIALYESNAVNVLAVDDFSVSNKYLWYDDYSDDELS